MNSVHFLCGSCGRSYVPVTTMRSFQPTDPGHYHGKFLAHWSKSLQMGCVQPTDPGNYCLDEHIWWPGLIQFCRDRELLRNANAETSLVTVYQDLLIYLTQCYCASRPTCLPNAMLQEIKTNFIYLTPCYCTSRLTYLPNPLLLYIKTNVST